MCSYFSGVMVAMGMCPLPLMVLAMLAAGLPTPVSCNGHFLNSFAVEVHGGQETVERVAKELGFVIKRQVSDYSIRILKLLLANH